jgi:hypothetical protein
VQVVPIKPTLKAPGKRRFKLKYCKLLSSFAFNFDLRRFTVARLAAHYSDGTITGGQGLTLAYFKAQLEDLRDTSLTLELNLSTFAPHPWVNFACVGEKVSFS